MSAGFCSLYSDWQRELNMKLFNATQPYISVSYLTLKFSTFALWLEVCNL